ncbi:hypothetical protein AMTRI_Chr03g54810 [Amborella trichopoda]
MFKNLDWWFDSFLWVTNGGKIEIVNGLSHMKFTGTSKENDVADKHEAPEVTASPKTPHPITSTIKTPIGARIGSKTEGGLGAQKLTTKPSESLYDQKPEEPTLVVSSSLFPSLFEYVESMQSAVQRPILVVRKYLTMSLHLKSSNFFADFGMDSGIKNKPSSTYSTVQESNEAQLKFSNAKSISSTQFFGDQNKASGASAQISFSTSIYSADHFGHNTDDPSLDLSASESHQSDFIPGTSSLAKLISIDTLLAKKLEILRKLMIHSSHGTVFYFFSLFFYSFAEH